MTPFEQTSSRGVLLLLDHPDDLAARLEEELVGPGLLEIVRDLEAVRGSAGNPADLPPSVRERIVASGLVGLSEPELQAVLERPRALLDVQKTVLMTGSTYWDSVVRRADARQESATTPAPPRESNRPQRTWLWVSHALTAAVAIAITTAVLWGRHSELRDELNQAQVANARLQRELAAFPPVTPADLPGDYVEVSAPDPDDLPGGDPADLPGSPKSRQIGV